MEYSNYKIALIDNDSPDNSEEVLRKRFPKYHFIQTTKNLGYGGGNNQGIRLALSNKAEYVWIVNPDVSLGSDSLTEMTQVMKSDHKIGICGPRLLWKWPTRSYLVDGATIIPEKGFENKLNQIEQRSLEEPLEIKNVGYVVGCSMFIRNKMVSEIGLFHEGFFMFYEDAEFCLRAQRFNWKTVIAPRIQHVHHRKLKDREEFNVYYFSRNRIFLARLNQKYIFRTMFAAFDFCFLIKRLRQGRIRIVWLVIKGVFVGLLKPIHL